MWICKQFKVLPSNPDFQNLTSEQRSLLWEDYLLDNPKLKEQIEHEVVNKEDEEFEELWKNESVEFVDMTEDINVEQAVENFKKIDEKEHDSIEYPEHAKRVFEMIKKHEKEQERINKLQLADWDDFDDGFPEV